MNSDISKLFKMIFRKHGFAQADRAHLNTAALLGFHRSTRRRFSEAVGIYRRPGSDKNLVSTEAAKH